MLSFAGAQPGCRNAYLVMPGATASYLNLRVRVARGHVHTYGRAKPMLHPVPNPRCDRITITSLHRQHT